jgi:hypothetical protein
LPPKTPPFLFWNKFDAQSVLRNADNRQRAELANELMFSENQKTEPTTALAAACAAVLRQGMELLEQIDDATFLFSETGAAKGTVGAHFRHCLDFYQSFLAGAKSGRIDYARRSRDPQIETNRRSAITCFRLVIAELEKFSAGNLNQPLRVKAEDSDEEVWFLSSPARELEFVRSHTVHHYALIRFKLALLGVETGEDFGVAPSTLRFWRPPAAAEGPLSAAKV